MRRLLNLAIIGLAIVIAGNIINCSGGSNDSAPNVSGSSSTVQPISCDSGTVQIDQVLEIDAEGQGPAIFATGNCNVVINSPGGVSLTNCPNCIRVLDNSSIEINANSSILIDSTVDAIWAQGNATVMLQANEKISITSTGEDGIDVENDSLVTLNAPDCIIRSFDLPIDKSGNGVVDTTGCTNSDFESVPQT